MIGTCDFPNLFFNKLGFYGDFIHNNRLNRIPNLWILWRRNLKVPVSVSESEQHVTIALDWGMSHIQISFVHASSFRAGRRALWLDLVADTPQTPTPWTVIGDFNACLQSHEKRGPGNFSLGSAAEFGAMVDACLLSQVPSMGRKFTWTNNRCRGNVCAVLDRGFCNEEWISFFQDCSQQVLPRFASDHSPLLVVSSSSQRPPNCPFRFNNFWTDHEDFDRVVAESWAEWAPGSPILSLMSKLKRLKGALKGWAKQTFPHFERDLDEAKKNLNHVQEEIDSNGLSDQLFRMEADAKTALLKAQENHEKLWAEKARLRWLTYGDRNSKFFHLSAKMRRNRNTIRSLKKQDGSIVEGQTNLGEYIVEFYEGFHKNAPTVDHLDLLDSIPRVLQQVDIFHLDSLPGNAEIMKAVWALDPESSPGPDGFSGKFFRKCWSIVEGDVCNAVKAFFRTSRMPKGVNNTFLILIPKVDGAETLDKYRPLCMSNFFCKIISKVLAMRLERFLPRLISEEQGAFQKGKLIHDNISVASELANLMYSATRGGGLGLKIDIRKAYDTISWSFLFKVMEKFGFSENWITWLHQLLASTKISVLVNGGPQGFFGVERGLRQGDPISPLLFIMAEEVLSRGLTRLTHQKDIMPICGPKGVVTPGHILFADDIFIFSNASSRYVANLKNFLMKYQEFSGQHISFEKSKLFLGKISPTRKQAIAETLGIPICSFPTRYLGVEIFKGRITKEALLPVLDKVKGRLAGWKGKLLSMAGRVELVRSVISGIPNHNFAIYWWPSALLVTMERWMKNFIWAGEVDTSKPITVKWESVCKPKEEGGLGIRRLRDTNMAMLCKLVWRIKHEKSAANSFLRARFVKKDGSFNRGCRPSSIALGIRKVWKTVEANERWIIGRGDLANFWKDKWWGPRSILEEIQTPDLPPLPCNAKVCDFIRNGEWSLPEVRSHSLRQIFLAIKEVKIPSAQFEDLCIWQLSPLGSFTTSSAWEDIRRVAPAVHWNSLVWHNNLPPRIATFGWRLAHERLPTDELIRKKGIFLVSRCSLCEQYEESMEHIFLHCPFSRDIWEKFTSCFAIRWSEHESIDSLFQWWKRKSRLINLKNSWMIGFTIIASQIWRERNIRRYEGKKRNGIYSFQYICQDLALYAGTSKGEVKSIADIMCCRKLGLKIDNPKIVPPLEVHWSEFSAVMEAILVAMNMNARGLWIESDSAAVVAATQKMHIPWFVLQKWRFALPFLQSITWKITHCFREANTVADFLAKKAAKSGASDYSTTFPSHVLDDLENDASGRHSFRFC
ncbi:uncharacterized protein LOC122059169 [Macadamia integrifolia]|uniref:uncharacterized protein LOC122059169 n=1 Tax=Macadamia integrifolia TaxID=60698 RepID=UPI001C53184B|nr:uncharacterized protein LOC122059169 [Macadamia integrifolia]